MNYEFFSCSLNNPLKYTDPSGYQYMIDGMEVTERAFFNYWRNMSGTEMYVEMVGSWNTAYSVWFLQQTSYTESIKEEKIYLTNTRLAFAKNAGVWGFMASKSGNRTKLWTGNVGSNVYLNHGGQPESTFWLDEGDALYGVFTLTTITSGSLVSIDDLQRGMRMSEIIEGGKWDEGMPKIDFQGKDILIVETHSKNYKNILDKNLYSEYKYLVNKDLKIKLYNPAPNDVESIAIISAFGAACCPIVDKPPYLTILRPDLNIRNIFDTYLDSKANAIKKLQEKRLKLYLDSGLILNFNE